MKPMLRQYNPRGSVGLWGARLIKSLVSITHKQWPYRNKGVHHVSNGLKTKQHQELTSHVQELLMTKKESFLEWHPHFTDIDFTKLGSGPTIARQVWVANFEMAISIAKAAQGNFCLQAALWLLHAPLATSPLRDPVTWPLPTNLPTSQVRHTDPMQQQQKIITQGYADRLAQLSRSPYFSSCTNRNTKTPQSVVHVHEADLATHTEMNRTQRKVFPSSTLTIKPQPHDKICAHINHLHTQMKALMTTRSCVT